MNKNTKSRKESVRDAFGRIKINRARPGDEILASTVGFCYHRKSKHPKVARGLAS